MQLPQSTPEIPELGGLSSRRADLAQGGIDALRKISALLARARRRARLLAVLRAAALVLAGLVAAGLCGALVGSFAGAAYARGAAGVVLALTLGFVVLFVLRSPLQRGAGWDDRALARLLAGPSGGLSRVELPRHGEGPGLSRELPALPPIRAPEQAS